MEAPSHFVFPPFWCDSAAEQLWQGEKSIPLRRQTFAVLRYLLEHAGQIVTKQALLDTLWPGIYVTDVAPMICINELRRALGDDARHPRFIETVHRRGYRFIAPLTSPPRPSLASRDQSLRSKGHGEDLSIRTLDSRCQTLDVPLVGRESELTQLQTWFDKALKGERQIVFITGEAGIGKTTLIEAFLQSLGSRVQCLESREENQNAKHKSQR